MKVTVLSDGAWGTALALTLISNGHETRQWGPFPEYIREMRETRVNSRFLKGVPLPDELLLLEDMGEAVDGAEMIILAAPSQYMRATLDKLTSHYSGQLLLNVSKGIETGTLLRMSELCHEIIGDSAKYAVLSGPSHAEEVALKTPTAIVVASRDHELAEVARDTFMNSFFRVYTSEDVIGLELGGALKNVFAIAAGVVDGMNLGDNPKAALITRGIAEMSRLGVALGGRRETFSGLSGIGDMIVTCTSGHSRNRHVGEELGKGASIDDIRAEMGMIVAEGVETAKSAYELSRRAGVDTPIINEVYQAIYEGKDSRQGVRDLMTRKPKRELA